MSACKIVLNFDVWSNTCDKVHTRCCCMEEGGGGKSKNEEGKRESRLWSKSRSQAQSTAVHAQIAHVACVACLWVNGCVKGGSSKMMIAFSHALRICLVLLLLLLLYNGSTSKFLLCSFTAASFTVFLLLVQFFRRRLYCVAKLIYTVQKAALPPNEYDKKLLNVIVWMQCWNLQND